MLFQMYFRQTHLKINLLVLTCKLYFVEGSVQKRGCLKTILSPREKILIHTPAGRAFLELSLRARPRVLIHGCDKQQWLDMHTNQQNPSSLPQDMAP